MAIFIILFVVVVLIILVTLSNANFQEREEALSKQRQEARLSLDVLDQQQRAAAGRPAFNPTFRMQGKTPDYLFLLDSSSREVVIHLPGQRISLSPHQILDSEIEVDKQTAYSQKGVVGRGIVGFVLGGIAGTVIGAATAKHQQQVRISEVTVRISIKNLDQPAVYFPMLNVHDIGLKPLDPAGTVGKLSLSNALQIHERLLILMKMNQES